MTNGTHDTLPRSEFWMRVAGAAFALWAIMIPVGVAMLRGTFSEMANANTSLANAFIEYKLATERRITLLEERQLQVLGRLAVVERNQYFQQPGEKPQSLGGRER